MIDKINHSNQIIIPSRVNDFSKSYGILKQVCKKSRMKIDYEIFSPTVICGYITISGKEINISDMRINEAFDLADNVDIFPMNNGNISLVLTFNRMTRLLEEE